MILKNWRVTSSQKKTEKLKMSSSGYFRTVYAKTKFFKSFPKTTHISFWKQRQPRNMESIEAMTVQWLE